MAATSQCHLAVITNIRLLFRIVQIASINGGGQSLLILAVRQGDIH